MRVSKEQAAENRERIIQVASTLFRRKGFQGIGVADLMKEAGLTHGGFYGHFASKEDLAAQACARALADGVQRWNGLAEGAPDDPMGAIAGHYLSARHRDDPGGGCAITALGVEVGRQEGPVRRAFTDGLNGFIAVLTRLVPGRSDAARRRRALATMSGLVGAVVLARAVEDPEFSDEILAAAAEAFSSEKPV